MIIMELYDHWSHVFTRRVISLFDWVNLLHFSSIPEQQPRPQYDKQASRHKHIGDVDSETHIG